MTVPSNPRQNVATPYPPRIVRFWVCGAGVREGERRCVYHGCTEFYERDAHAVNLAVFDFPTGHAINQNANLTHVPECSSAQTGMALLCDCGAVEREWSRLRAEHGWTISDDFSRSEEGT